MAVRTALYERENKYAWRSYCTFKFALTVWSKRADEYTHLCLSNVHTHTHPSYWMGFFSSFSISFLRFVFAWLCFPLCHSIFCSSRLSMWPSRSICAQHSLSLSLSAIVESPLTQTQADHVHVCVGRFVEYICNIVRTTCAICSHVNIFGNFGSFSPVWLVKYGTHTKNTFGTESHAQGPTRARLCVLVEWMESAEASM